MTFPDWMPFLTLNYWHQSSERKDTSNGKSNSNSNNNKDSVQPTRAQSTTLLTSIMPRLQMSDRTS